MKILALLLLLSCAAAWAVPANEIERHEQALRKIDASLTSAENTYRKAAARCASAQACLRTARDRWNRAYGKIEQQRRDEIQQHDRNRMVMMRRRGGCM